ncbi:MAG TPA: STAS domain-containing protein [Actinomycetes bacterium]
MIVTGRAASQVCVTLDDSTLTQAPAGLFSTRLCALLDDEAGTLVIDLSGVQGLSSDLMAALLSVRREATARSCRVVLRATSRRSIALLRQSSLGGLFDVTTTDLPGSVWRHG